MDKKTLVEAEQ